MDCHKETSDNGGFPHREMKIEIDGSTTDSERRICLMLLIEDADGTSTCTPQTIADQVSTSYTYTIGDSALSIPYPTVDGCSLTCSLVWTPPIAGVLTDTGSSYDIQTDDVSIVLAGAASRTVNGFTVSTNPPCAAETHTFSVMFVNPCESTPTII